MSSEQSELEVRLAATERLLAALLLWMDRTLRPGASMQSFRWRENPDLRDAFAEFSRVGPPEFPALLEAQAPPTEADHDRQRFVGGSIDKVSATHLSPGSVDRTFVANADVHAGQSVTICAIAGGNNVVPCPPGDVPVGYARHNANAGQLVAVMLRGNKGLPGAYIVEFIKQNPPVFTDSRANAEQTFEADEDIAAGQRVTLCGGANPGRVAECLPGDVPVGHAQHAARAGEPVVVAFRGGR